MAGVGGVLAVRPFRYTEGGVPMRRTSMMLAGLTLFGCGPTIEDEGADEHSGAALGESVSAIGFWDNTGAPVGGGEDYGSWIVEGWDALVRTRAGLVAALSAAASEPGYVIYVDDLAVIDMTDRDNNNNVLLGTPPLGETDGVLMVPRGTIIASGRGRNGSIGALIHRDNPGKRPLFALEDDVRITGLRIQGPDTGELPIHGCNEYDATGIKIHGRSNVVIDNNELFGWSNVAVWTDAELYPIGDNFVRHNHIHHNRRENNSPTVVCGEVYGMGYGVQADLGDTIIEANVFDHNRHDVASKGFPNHDYEAKFNLVLAGASDSTFDVHGCHENPPCYSPGTAGRDIRIHHNSVLQTEYPAVLVRGRPDLAANVYMNEFRCNPFSTYNGNQCVAQIDYFGNFNVYSNDFTAGFDEAWYVSLSGRFKPPMATTAGPGSHWAFRRFNEEGTSGFWNPTSVALYDFDGDRRADALRSTGSAWEMSKSVKGKFAFRAGSGLAISQLGFADFNGDGRTDVFAQFGGTWQYSSAAVGSWTDLANYNYQPSALGFADFDGNGTADVFLATGFNWLVSFGGAQSFVPLKLGETATLSNVRFGRFVGGDAKADVFKIENYVWKVSSGGTGGWTNLRTVRSRLVPS